MPTIEAVGSQLLESYPDSLCHSGNTEMNLAHRLKSVGHCMESKCGIVGNKA